MTSIQFNNGDILIMFKTYYRNDGDNVSLFLNYSSDNVIRDNIDILGFPNSVK